MNLNGRGHLITAIGDTFASWSDIISETKKGEKTIQTNNEFIAAGDLVRIKVDDVARFDEFLEGKDFKKLNEDIAVKYKNHLKNFERNGSNLLLRTINGKLLSVIEFYIWLKVVKNFVP